MTRIYSLFSSCLLLAASEVVYDMASPNGNVTGTLKIDDDGVVFYQVKLGTEIVIPFSPMGLELATDTYPENSLYDNFKMAGIMPFYLVPRLQWTPSWGEQRVIKDHYNQITIRTNQNLAVRRQMLLHLRAYDIGIAFTMEFPEQDAIYELPILQERTEFRMLGDHLAWWAPADYDAQDYNFVESKLSEIESLAVEAISSNVTIQQGSPIGGAAVQTPITMKTEGGIYISLHEGGGSTFPSMNLEYNAETMTFKSHLTPDSSEFGSNRGVLTSPMSIPWRAVMVTRDPAAMLTSHMIYNLNDEAETSETTSWVKPMKSVGVWWELVTGNHTWRYTDELSSVEIGVTDYSQVTPNGLHGATTERIQEYIDFAATNSFDAVCFEGWNEGWEEWLNSDKNVLFDFIKAYPDVDEEQITRTAGDRQIALIKHHEVGSAIGDYALNAPKALSHTADIGGYAAVKVGYHGASLNNGSHHTSQSTNEHYKFIIEEALKNRLSISIHGGLKPTGLSRTYPNLLTATVGRTNAHSALGISRTHATILPWNHLIGAPIEYGAGVIRGSKDSLMTQIALLMVLYAPNQLIADTPENWEAQPSLLRLVADLPNTWDQSIYLETEIGRYVTVARQGRDSNDWFIGGISAVEQRVAHLPLDFLDADGEYLTTILTDTVEKDTLYTEQFVVLRRGDTLSIEVANNGGFVAKLVKQVNSSNESASAD